MADGRLRELERRWQQSGSVQDEAAYLLERVREGDLTKERLELAAYLGYPAASSGVGVRAHDPQSLEDFVDFARGLKRFERQAKVRAALAVALRLPRPEEAARPFVDRCVAATARWVLDPNEENARAAASAGLFVPDYLGVTYIRYRGLGWATAGSDAWNRRFRSIRDVPDEERAGPEVECLVECWHDLQANTIQAIRDDVVPWSLGYGDPVADRFQARGEASSA